VTTLNGEVVCSMVDGGGAMKQSDGTVRCQGGCEYASLDLCERTSAAW
jgi:RecJ-like exonuclease